MLKNNYLMIGIDGSMAENGSDWFCYHATSPCIFPVGFCKINGLDLTPPRGLFVCQFFFIPIVWNCGMIIFKQIVIVEMCPTLNSKTIYRCPAQLVYLIYVNFRSQGSIQMVWLFEANQIHSSTCQAVWQSK